MNLPEENIGSATSKVRQDSTPQGGALGVLEELNDALKNCKDIEFY